MGTQKGVSERDDVMLTKRACLPRALFQVGLYIIWRGFTGRSCAPDCMNRGIFALYQYTI